MQAALLGCDGGRSPLVESLIACSVAPLRKLAAPIPDDSLADAEDAIVTNDPFRLSNSPPAVRYDPASDGTAAGTLTGPLQARPTLVLKAIVGGPPWQAVIDGIPGQPPGTVARAGSKFDRFTVRVVTRDSVVVQGADTSWVLSFRARYRASNQLHRGTCVLIASQSRAQAPARSPQSQPDSVTIRIVGIELRSAVQIIQQYIDRPIIFSGPGPGRR